MEPFIFGKRTVRLLECMWATARMSAKEQSYFGIADLLLGYGMRIFRVVMTLLLWKSLLLTGVDGEGFTLGQMLTYTLMGAVFADWLNVQTPAANWFYDGSIVTPYLRPMGIFSQLAAQTAGHWVLPLLFCTLPLLLIAALMGIYILPVTFWMLPSLALSVSLGFAVDFLFACYVIRLKDAGWMAVWLRRAVTLLLSGAFIPMAVLPWGLGGIFRLLPPASMAGAPLSLYVGLSTPLQVLPLQLFWNVLLWPLAIRAFACSRERMVSYGG